MPPTTTHSVCPHREFHPTECPPDRWEALIDYIITGKLDERLYHSDAEFYAVTYLLDRIAPADRRDFLERARDLFVPVDAEQLRDRIGRPE